MSVAQAAVILTALNGLGLLIRFLSTSAFAFRHGTSALLDAYFSGAAIPLAVIGILTSALAMTAVPLLSRWKLAGSTVFRSKMRRVLCGAWIASVLLCVFVGLGATSIVEWLLPGLEPSYRDFSSMTLAIQIWSLPALLHSELLTSILFVRGRYVWPALVRFGASLSTTICIVLFQGKLGLIAVSLSTVLFSFLGVVALIPSVKRTEVESAGSERNTYVPERESFVGAYLILVFGMLTYKSLPLFDRWLASGLEAGSISVMTYALRIIELPQSLILSGLVTSTFPFLANLVAENDFRRASVILERLVKASILMFVFLSVSGFCFARPILSLVLQHGEMPLTSFGEIHRLFQIYCFALPFLAACGVMGQAYYINRANLTVAIFGIAETIFYVMSCYLFVSQFNVQGFAMNYAISYAVFFFVNALYLELRYECRLFTLGGLAIFWHSCAALASCVPILLGMRWLSIELTVLSAIVAVCLSAICFACLQIWKKSDEFLWLCGHLSARFRRRLTH